ncbi:GIY-YIG nuclease family protein [Luteibaculum oceani]|uniref:GIY-YIG nuclease family protein n=1 Tax=Luteibaculum oceani TaxID=1294296 RepID=A0A5C6V7Y0_9FLAO|nr:GIY-YIG nuclease family protein [Luteibaculum oceani]TXC81392.1 GIY-YIG nuclease family protein [Luteibaculum oceani]
MRLIPQHYYVYIVSNYSRTVYHTSSSDNMRLLVYKFKRSIYNSAYERGQKTNQLMFYERFNTRKEAEERVKEIRNWDREKKEKLIKKINPQLLCINRVII